MTAERLAYHVPGRIEVLGKHTDYAGGRSLLCAVERGLEVTAAPRADARVRVVDARRGTEIEFTIGGDLRPAAGHWSNYPMTVARRLARDFPGDLKGADIAFTSDLPRAAGLSSSSALVVATFVVLADVNGITRPPEHLAGYLGAVESGRSFGTLAGDAGVGTAGGSEDHTAILLARPGALVQYAFCPVRFERAVRLPRDHVFVVGTSGVVADKTGAARERYNQAARAVERMLEAWRRETGRADESLAAALASAPDAPGRFGALLRDAPALRDRLEQFRSESEVIVPAAGDALARGDLATFGELVDRSQGLAERLLGNQVPETVALARAARALGAVAASAFGAGFGGSVWALVRAEGAGEFRAAWAARYAREFPAAAARAEFFVTRAGPALRRQAAGAADRAP